MPSDVASLLPSVASAPAEITGKRNRKAAPGAFDARRLQVQPNPEDLVSKHRTICNVKCSCTWEQLQAVKASSAVVQLVGQINEAAQAVFPACNRGAARGPTRQPAAPPSADEVKQRVLFQIHMEGTRENQQAIQDDPQVQDLLMQLRTAAAAALEAIPGATQYQPRRGTGQGA